MGFRIVLALLCALTLSAAEVGADISFAQTEHFTLKKDGTSYRLGAQVFVRKKPLTLQGLRHLDLEVVEECGTKVSKLQGYYRGERIDSDKVSFHYPKHPGTFTPPARVHEVALPKGIKPGDEISCDYQVAYDDPAYFPLVSIPALNKMDCFKLEIDHPADVEVDFEFYNPGAEIKPSIQRTPTQTTVVFENLPAPMLLPRNPHHDIHAVVLTKLSSKGQCINPYPPEAFYRWFLEKVRQLGEPSEAMTSLLAAELKTAATTSAKARILFDFVKAKVRYIGDEGNGHAFIPHRPSDVLEQKWGDCKDKAWLLSELGRIHGIPIHPVLLSTEPKPMFSGLNLEHFNHVICALEDGGSLIFMDPTNAYLEMGDLPDADMLSRGFLMDPRNPRWLTVSCTRAEPSVDVFLEGEIANAKEAKAKVVLRHGWYSAALRAQKEMKAIELENMLSNRLNGILAKISIDHFKVVSTDGASMTLEAEADLSDFFVGTDLRMYALSAPFRTIPSEFLDRSQDTLPLDADGPDAYRLRMKLGCAGLKPTVEEIALGLPGKARYTASCSETGGCVRFEYLFEQPLRMVSAEDRTAFLAYCSQYLQLNRKLFTLQRKAQ